MTTALNDCGCCEGLTLETPVAVNNRPGLSAIAYRVGTHAQFKASMLARLSGADVTELANLRTREGDDFTIALLDAWAVVADILTFYQERIATESYLRTATERQSVINLARLIGYELRPGVAASTYLAFTMETGTGAPAAITIEKGQRVQSVPGPGEKPQTFETDEEIEARPQWNALRPLQSKIRLPQAGDTESVLDGVTTNLKVGDALLIVGAERLADPKNENWDLRRITSVKTDTENGRTTVGWKETLGSVVPHTDPPKKDPRVCALRLKASLFGFNAPEWKALPVALRVGEANPDPATQAKKPFLGGAFSQHEHQWADAKLASTTTAINLDAVYNQIAADSWLVLASSGYAEVYRITAVAEEAKTGFNISAKTTRLEISGEHIGKFSPRNAAVFAQSEELELGETPIVDPVWKNEIVLDSVVDGLESGRALVVSGKPMRATVGTAAKDWKLTSRDGAQNVPLTPGDSLIVAALPVDVVGDPARTRWRLIDKRGFEGFIDAASVSTDIVLAPSSGGDTTVSEVVQLDEAILSADAEHTILKLAASLANVYDRTTVTIYGNVALATHGETIKDEILGSGDAGLPYQSFELQQSPLTYTPADASSGGTSTLEVRVNDLKCTEVPHVVRPRAARAHLCHAEGRRGHDHRAVRRRPHGCASADGQREHQGHISKRDRTGRVSARRPVEPPHDPTPRAARRDESSGRLRRAGPAVPFRRPYQRAADGTHPRSRRFIAGL